MATAVEWYHQRLLDDPAARPARDYLRSRGLHGDVARQFKLGWAPDEWDALARQSGIDTELLRVTGLAFANRAGRMQDAFRARVLFPIFSDTGDAVAIGGRVLPGSSRPGEVQELAGDADLLQVAHAVRPQLGEGRRHQPRPGRRVRGLHRRDRLPPGRRAPGGGDVRHGVHRGPRAPAQALRQPCRAGVRRRRRRPGRRRALLRVGAEVPDPGVGRPPARRHRSRRARPARPRGAGRGRRRPGAVPRLPPAPRRRSPPGAHPGGAGRPRPARRWPSSTSIPTSTCARCTPARSPPRPAWRSPTSSTSPSVAAAARSARSPGRRSALRENAEFAALTLLAQDWDAIAGWLIEELFRDDVHRRAFLALAAADGDLDRRPRRRRSRRPRGPRTGGRRRPRRRPGGRGPQPDRRRRPPRARRAGVGRRSGRGFATTPRPACSWKIWASR